MAGSCGYVTADGRLGVGEKLGAPTVETAQPALAPRALLQAWVVRVVREQAG